MFINLQKDKGGNNKQKSKQQSKQQSQLVPQLNSMQDIPIDVQKCQEQTKLDILGVEVYFPYNPYPQQLEYMKNNALLQSPTGTGKTLCLLCASLAWLKKKRCEKLKAIDNISLENLEDIDNISIIYQSRTHSQLKQVVRELKKTVYQPRLVTLGSRDQYCIKSDFQFMKGSQLNGACKKAIKKDEVLNRCTYYKPDWQGQTYDHMARQCLDIEETKSYFKSHKECPYFVAMNVRKSADIILFPYNYTMQLKMDDFVELKNNILIYDEAHNIQNIAEEGQSFTITLEQLIEAEKQMQEFDLYVATNKVDIISSNDQVVNPKEMKPFTDPIVEFRKYLNNLKFPQSTNNYQQEVGIEMDGCQIFSIIKENTKIVDNKTSIETFLNLSKQNCQWTGGLEKKNVWNYFNIGKAFSETMVLYGQQAWALDHWLVFIEILSKMKEKDVNCYKIYIKQDISTKSVEFNLWCLDPSIAFQNVLGQIPHNIILTSGTLEPFDTWPLELKIQFDVQLNNQHVANVSQNVLCRILTKSQNNQQFDFSYANRQNDQLYEDLGVTITNISKYIPNGILVIFCSYGIMEKTRAIWAKKAKSILLKLAETKPLYWEPKQQSELHHTMKNFEKDAITNKGAILFGVSRGKVSEGIDFSDELCRCVILIGIPYPPLQDKRIIMKKEYLDKSGSQLNSKYWYKTQAVRSTNQTIGRVLRHIDDFGCVYLIDQRFQWNDLRNSLSKWILPIVEVNQDIEKLETDTKNFFISHSTHIPKPVVPQAQKTQLSYQKVQEQIKENSQGSEFFGLQKNFYAQFQQNSNEAQQVEKLKTYFDKVEKNEFPQSTDYQKQKVVFKYNGLDEKMKSDMEIIRNSFPPPVQETQKKKNEKTQFTLDQYYFVKKN